MIIEQGIVKFIDSSRVTVECRSRLDCIRCAQGKGCGGGILSRWLGNRQFQIKAYYDSGQVRPQIGQVVSVGFPASRLVHLAAIMYGLP
ncbi:MAG: SoxR reducing system RseC family protein, partial [Gammaproteobacteria bacterium]|nr:SoxR reducing system RseC family protein [Gammaproteobacteria bacterium]